MTVIQPTTEHQLVTRCSWCGKAVDPPETRSVWDVRKYEPVFCCGKCLKKYQEQLSGSPF